MGVTWRDVLNTVLAAIVAVIGLAVAGEWGWPLLGSYRAGTLAVGLVGWAMCILSSSGQIQSRGMRDPMNVLMTALGVITLALIVTGLIVGSETLFMLLTVDTLAMWLVATIRHSLAGSGAPKPISHSPWAG